MAHPLEDCTINNFLVELDETHTVARRKASDCHSVVQHAEKERKQLAYARVGSRRLFSTA